MTCAPAMFAEGGVTRKRQAERGGEQDRANQQPVSGMSVQTTVSAPHVATRAAPGKIAHSCTSHFRHLRVPAIEGATVGGPRTGRVALRLQQHTKIECSPGLVALIRPAVGRLRLGQFTSVFEENTQIASGAAVATLVRAGVGLLGSAGITPLAEQHTEPERAAGFAALVGATVRRFGAGQLTPLFEQHAEIEGADGLAALSGAAVGRLSSGWLTPFFEEHTEIGSRPSVTALVRATVRCLGTAQLTALFELNAELERLSGLVDVRGRPRRLCRQLLECSCILATARAWPPSRNHACSIP